MKKPVIHWRSRGLFVNAGMRFPACYAGAELLDIDKSRLPTTGEEQEVTCKRCRRIITSDEKGMGFKRTIWEEDK